MKFCNPLKESRPPHNNLTDLLSPKRWKQKGSVQNILLRISGPKGGEVTVGWRELLNEELRILYYSQIQNAHKLAGDLKGA
jgi:hypothetical protein